MTPERSEIVDRWQHGEISVEEMLDEIARLQNEAAAAAVRETCPTCGQRVVAEKQLAP